MIGVYNTIAINPRE